MDYLQTVGRPYRWAAIAALGAAVVVLVAVELFLVAITFLAPGFNPAQDAVLLGAMALFGALLAACVWLLARLLRRPPGPGDGLTFPVWIVGLTGVVVAAAGAYAAWRGNWPAAAATLPAALAIGRICRDAVRSGSAEEEDDPGTGSASASHR